MAALAKTAAAAAEKRRHDGIFINIENAQRKNSEREAAGGGVSAIERSREA